MWSENMTHQVLTHVSHVTTRLPLFTHCLDQQIMEGKKSDGKKMRELCCFPPFNEERIKLNVGLTYKFSLYSCEENCGGKKKISKMTIMPT